MAKFTDILYRWSKINRHYLITFFVLVLFIGLSILGYKWFKKTDTPYSDVANAKTRGQEVEIYIFTVTWCPHCKTARPEWTAFKEQYEGKRIGPYVIHCVQVDCTDKDDIQVQKMRSKYNISSFPTVKMVKDGKIIDFDAKITTGNLNQFVSTMVG
jgi:thiol-disulfide isomerase/thioredoxin